MRYMPAFAAAVAAAVVQTAAAAAHMTQRDRPPAVDASSAMQKRLHIVAVAVNV